MNSSTIDILLIEDHADDAELTMRALRKNPAVYQVKHINNGEEALHYLFCQGPYKNRNIRQVPKLILLDLKMPGIDGLEVIRRLKLHDQTKVIPVVVLTSSKEDRDILASYQLGANSYFVKPVDFESFLLAISNLSLYWLQLNQAAPQLIKTD